jgi:hypothetical protein
MLSDRDLAGFAIGRLLMMKGAEALSHQFHASRALTLS